MSVVRSHWPLWLILLLMLGCATPREQLLGPPLATPHFDGTHFVTADGARLFVQTWAAESPRAAIVALHGMNDYAKAFAMPGPWWAERGITVYAYDQRGFGRSPEPGIWPGAQTLVSDASQFIEAARARHPGVPLFVVGDSMGGAVALSLFAGADAPPVDGLVLVSPAVWGWKALNPFYRMTLWIAAHTFPGATLTGRSLKIWPSDNVEMLRDLGRDPLMIKKTRTDAIYGLVGLMDNGYDAADEIVLPTLVLYGDKDEIIPREPVEIVIERLNGDTRVAIYENGYHMLLRDLQREIVWQDVEAWIENPVASLPSGEEETAALRSQSTAQSD